MSDKSIMDLFAIRTVLIVALICSKVSFSAPLYTVESLANLVDGFRFQQMTMSNTMLNLSQALRLPEKLAEAEAQEADQRTMTALRGADEARTPFIATSSRLGLGYIGRGYDIYLGNPISDDGIVDQGFRLPVIELPFSYRFTSDGEYRIPDNVDVISETSASFGSSFHQLKTETDYESMLQVDVSVNGNFKGFGFSGSFSASSSYQKAVKELTKGETTTLDIVGKANVYKARLSPTPTISKLSEFFEEAIRVLPSANCMEESIQQMYIEMIEKFGTHYTTEVIMGAKAVQELRFKNSDLDRFQSVGLSVKVAAKFQYKSIFQNGGGSFSVGVSSNEKFREMVSNTEKEQREYYIGGSPPSGDYSTGSTEPLREWARSAAENPAPIQYKLSSIDTLLRPEYFKKTIDDLYDRRKCLREALFTYCTRTISISHCKLSSENSADSFKFGDFVRIKNKDKFLALSQSFGVAPALTIKPLTSVSTITNYDGLLQLFPPSGLDSKLGNSIRYGEPFLLKTIEGDMLYMGKDIILNKDMPSQSRMMDLFTNKDEQVSVNISYSKVADFTLFLKKEEVASYLVSVQAHCYHNKSATYQIDLYGVKGTVSTNVDVRCTCNKRYADYCFYDWFHSIATEQDIGNIQTARFMGLYGAVTNPIFAFAVKTLINGEKRDVTWRQGECSGRVTTIYGLASRSKTIKQDIYPVQFTFHSKEALNIETQSIKKGDFGYIQILSSLPNKKTYWDQTVTHLLSVDSMGKIVITEVGPKPHIPISSVCSGLIYPSSAELSYRHDFGDYIIISFEVTVMVNYIEIEYAYNSSFYVAYINQLNESFLDIPNVSKNTVNTTLNITLNAPLYTTAIKIYTSLTTNKNISEIVKMIDIGGCTRAVIDTGDTDTSNQEWEMVLSDNKIQNYPYLKVVPKNSDFVDPKKLFNSSYHVRSGSFSYETTINSDQAGCVINVDSLANYLTQSSDTAELKFNNIQITNYSNGNQLNLLVTMDVSALNKLEYDRGYMTLNQTVNNAIKSYKCSAPQSALLTGTAQSTGDQSTSSVSSTGIIVGFTILAVLLVAILGFLAFSTYRRKNKGN